MLAPVDTFRQARREITHRASHNMNPNKRASAIVEGQHTTYEHGHTVHKPEGGLHFVVFNAQHATYHGWPHQHALTCCINIIDIFGFGLSPSLPLYA